jgi:Protein of unknown function (DUF2591)
MRIKTTELIRATLDWAVAKCNGYSGEPWQWVEEYTNLEGPHYSTDWAHGGPLMERERLDGFWNPETSKWSIAGWDDRGRSEVIQWHESLLVAAMRCYVTSRMGDEVEVPDELS